MKFIFMDETYMPPTKRGSATTLTGLLIPASDHSSFRAQFYELLKAVRPTEANIVPQPPDVHAATLFPELGADDTRRFAFLNGLVDLILQLDLRVYRVGYYNTPEMLNSFKTERAILGLCFLGILWSLADELQRGPVWPVMEIDRSPEQDRHFAGQVRSIDHMTAHLSSADLSIDNANLGELLYTTKQSALGAAVDCVAYLRQTLHLQRTGETLSPFKARLATIAERLEPAVATDETNRMKFHSSVS